VDVDGFKTSTIHSAPWGDELLKQIARRMSEYVKDPSELLRGWWRTAFGCGARAHRPRGRRRAAHRAQLASVLRYTPFRVGEAGLRISAKVGLSVFPNGRSDADTLFKNAEAALKKVKETNERYLFYTHQLTERIRRAAFPGEQACARRSKDRVRPALQPKVRTETPARDRCRALIRWMSPEHGWSPACSSSSAAPRNEAVILESARMALERPCLHMPCSGLIHRISASTPITRRFRS